MREAFAAGKMVDCANFIEHDELSVRASVKVRECHSEVEQEDDNRTTIAQHIVDFLRRIVVASRRARRDHTVVCMPSMPPIPD